MAKLEVIFELGGVPTEAKFLDMTEQQYAVLSYFQTLKKQKFNEDILEAVEYLAMLVSPMPKETMKVIDGRRKMVAKAKREAGLTKDEQEIREKIIEKNMQGETAFLKNTTFFDDVEKFAGKDAADALRREQGAMGDSSVVQHEIDFEDLEYIELVKKQQAEVAQMKYNAELAASKIGSVEF
jgi:hypothetical protein